MLSFSAQAFGTAAPRDSVGMERRNGKLFVKHKVEPKETLYALSRKYNLPVERIVEANPHVQTTIKIGEVIFIPRGYVSMAAGATASAAPEASKRTYTVSDAGYKMHTVEPQQTLYSISRMYNATVEDIRKWNGLASNNIPIGAKLIVGKGAEQVTKKPVYVPEPDDEIRATDSSATATASASTEPVSTASSRPASDAQATANTTVTLYPTNERIEEQPAAEDATGGINRMLESGMAEMIDAKTMDTNKYLALHKTAPVGTIMQVKNMMNGEVVYVRVIGKLPDTGANDKVIVRLSKKAYQKLGAVDQRFRVELSYMP